MAEPSAPGQRTGRPLIESDRVEGTTVLDRHGHSVGSIKRLMIEKISGKVVYAVVSFVGFLGVGEEGHTGKQALEFAFPAELGAALAFYLGHVHPMLCDGAQLGAPLWPSLQKGKRHMTAHGIYTRITQITAAHLGHPVTPRMFRDAAATLIAEMTPERAMMAAADRTGSTCARRPQARPSRRLPFRADPKVLGP